MFSVLCNGKLVCISPTYRGAEKYIKKKKDKDIYKYIIVKEELFV